MHSGVAALPRPARHRRDRRAPARWAWYHRLAVRPLGTPPAPFRTFVFSDQLVWGWVAAAGLVLIPVPEPWRLLGANLLLVLGVLYAARGLAVVALSREALRGRWAWC